MPQKLITIRRPLTVFLLLLVTLAIITTTLWISGKSYSKVDPRPFEDLRHLAKLLTSSRRQVSMHTVAVIVVPIVANVLLFVPWGFLLFLALYTVERPTMQTYVLTTGYQFNDPMRRTVKANDDLVDRLIVKRNAFYVNGLGADQRLSEMLFRQGTDRLLATPLFARGRLVGFLDLRDKAAKKPFENPDLEAARRIADQIVELLGSRNLFGLAPIPLSAAPDAPAPRINTPMPFSAPAIMPPSPAISEGQSELSPAARKAIEAAREMMSRKQHAAAATRRLINDEALDGARIVLPAALAIPGALLAALTATRNVKEAQTIIASAGMTADANDALQKHIRGWLERANQPQLNVWNPRIVYPFGTHADNITASRVGALVSAPVHSHNVEGLVVFTVALAQPPDAAAQKSLRALLRQMEPAVDTATG